MKSTGKNMVMILNKWKMVMRMKNLCSCLVVV